MSTVTSIQHLKPPVPADQFEYKRLKQGEFWRHIPAYAEIDEATFLDHLWQQRQSVKTAEELLQTIRGVCTAEFYRDAESGNLPEVSFVRPYEPYSGHPGNSAVSAYEYFVLSIANEIISKPDLFATAAIVITFDEGGGYYDSGYIQPLDFFGDGTRIPMLVISPYTKPGSIDHAYSDHGSVLKFIEKNWRLKPLSPRSRDNMPNPIASRNDPYVPTNGPAISDLMSVFDFSQRRKPVLIIPGGI